MIHPRSPGVVALLTCIALAGAPPAVAQAPAQNERFAAAQVLFENGSYAPAYEEFKALAAETGSPNAKLYVALCLHQLGRTLEAYEATEIALRDAAARAGTDPKYMATREAAAAELAKLEREVGRVTLVIADPPAGLVVSVNGNRVARDELGKPRAVAAGATVVRATAPGRRDFERRIELQAGQATTLSVQLRGSHEAEPSGVSYTRIAGIAVAGIGVAGMATFGVAGTLANRRYDALTERCGGWPCKDADAASDLRAGKRLDLTANIGLGVGVAGIVGGVLLFVLGGTSTSAPEVSAWASPSEGGLLVNARF